MEQAELFSTAAHIIEKLTDYAVEIRGQVIKADEAIDKKRGEIKVLREKLVGIDKAIAEAQAFAAAVAPVADPETAVIEFIPDPSTFGEEGPDETEEEKLRTMDEPGPADEGDQ